MASKSPITLLNFFIFNSNICEKEGEEYKKVLYYYPDGADANTRIKDVGLCEAVIKFTETFSSKPCESLHTQKTRQIFLQPEKDFWMVMSLGVPSQQKTRDGQVYTDYNGDEIQDHVYQSILLTSYRLFSLMKGTFINILEKSDNNYEVLQQSIEQFFNIKLGDGDKLKAYLAVCSHRLSILTVLVCMIDKYLPTLKVGDADLLDVFEGIHFLSLERYPFLKIQSFINMTEERFKNIKHLVFLYSNQLVWSGLDQDDMQILYRHLAMRVIPSYVDSELKGGIHSPFCNTSASSMQFGRFMTGPKSSDDKAGLQTIPKVYLQNGKIGCHLVIYRALNATLCVLIGDEEVLDLEFFRELDSEIGSELTSLASELSDQYSKTTSLTASDASSKYMYMYFNHMNLAEKTTVHSGLTRMGYALLSPEIMKLLADLNRDLSELNDNGEVIGKTTNDCWILGKLSDQREFYFVLQQKNANIVDVSEEMKKLVAAHFQNIFILD